MCSPYDRRKLYVFACPATIIETLDDGNLTAAGA